MSDIALSYNDGTVRIEGLQALDGQALGDAVVYDERSQTGRLPAYQYGPIRDELAERSVSVTDDVLAASAVTFSSDYRLRSYQQRALESWEATDRRGVLELPTGSGKTVIGLAAIEACAISTLVVVPTIDLLEQWERELAPAADGPVGRLGGGEQRVADLTVATYDSAYLRADELGDRFGLVVFDEAHHLGAEGYRDIARLLVAPARLGLTATFERPDGAHEVVAELLGPVVDRLTPEALAGEHLAPYDIKRITVELTPEERDTYERHQGTFTDYLAESNLSISSGAEYQQLVKRSGTDPRAREALLAKQRAKAVTTRASRKTERLRELLDRHCDDRVLVFTTSTELVYELAERLLMPAITHETGADERRAILNRFREGTYTRVVTANVLDEGIDVPDANVAVLLAGSGSQREFTQRLGRILRPSDDGGRARLYELVAADTAEMRVARRRRE